MNNIITETNEKALVMQAADGSKEAFCRLYGIYKDKLYRYAFYRLGSPEDAEDAVSDCVLAAWTELRDLKNPQAFGSWIFRILHGCCAKRIKEEIRSREKLENSIRNYRNYSSSFEDPSLSVELSEALAQLSRQEQDVVLLSVIGGLNSNEISAVTGLTSGAARSKLSRSLAKMRIFLT